MLTYPHTNAAQAVAACKLMVLFYVYDEFTDVESEESSRHIAAMVMDALRNPHKPRPAGEFRVAELARQYFSPPSPFPQSLTPPRYWAEAVKIASPMAQSHFITAFQQYVDAVTEQARDRESDRIRTIPEFWRIRDHTGGCLPAFALIEMDLDFPEDLYQHPKLERLREIANRSIAGCNVLLTPFHHLII